MDNENAHPLSINLVICDTSRDPLAELKPLTWEVSSYRRFECDVQLRRGNTIRGTRPGHGQFS